MEYEYKVLSIQDTTDAFMVKQLNELGSYGWKVVGVVSASDGNGEMTTTRIFLMREKDTATR